MIEPPIDERYEEAARFRALEADAARYRWLRDRNTGMGALKLAEVIRDDYQPPYWDLKHGPELDVAIDAAMKINTPK